LSILFYLKLCPLVALQFVFLLLMKHLKMITNTRKKISVIWTYFLWSQSDIVLIWTYFLWSQSDIVLIWTYFLWSQSDIVLIWTYFLWSQSDIVLILILKLICQCDVKHIMMLPEGWDKHYHSYHSESDRRLRQTLSLLSQWVWLKVETNIITPITVSLTEGWDKHYHSYHSESDWKSCDTCYNVCWDLQNWCFCLLSVTS
jgi:hypothetical protein